MTIRKSEFDQQVQSLMLRERTAPGTPGAGLTVVYAKVDGKVYSKDEAGIETILNADTLLRSVADHANSTVTATDIPGLGFTPVANSLYVIEGLVPVQTAITTTGVQLILAGPTTGITWSAVTIHTPTASNADTPFHGALNAAAPMTAGLTAVAMARVKAMVQVGASPGAGNIRLQLRSEIAASAVTVRAGAFLRYRTI